MNKRKNFAVCLYIKQGKATRSLSDQEVIKKDPLDLAMDYAKSGADILIVFDQSSEDNEHEETLDLIRNICDKVKIPVYGAGHISRLEDVKKLIYAGCAKTALNFSKESNIALMEEASKRFGKDQIAVCYRAADAIHSHQETIVKYCSELILINEKDVRGALTIKEVPSLLMLPEISLDKILSFLSEENVSGIAGNAVNDNLHQMDDIKALCKENGIDVRIHEAKFSWDQLVKDSQGLVPVIVQEESTKEVLMVAYMNEEAYRLTVKTGMMTYFSRSRKELWVKGESSGHYQYVKSLTVDCDCDTILAKVDQIGPACHTGHHSCFFQEDLVLDVRKEQDPMTILEQDYETILNRKEHPKEGSYTTYLFDKGIDKMLKKLGEECTETVIAAKNGKKQETVYEIADLMYHLMVVMAQQSIRWDDVKEEMVRRSKTE